MAKDTAIARNVVAQLVASQLSTSFNRDPCNVIYSHDEYIDYDTFTDAEIRIMPGSMEHLRGSRTVWIDGAVITIKITGVAEDPKEPTELDEWLDFVDEIVDIVKDAKPVGKKATRIESVQRYDKNLLRTGSIYSTTYAVGYSQI